MSDYSKSAALLPSDGLRTAIDSQLAGSKGPVEERYSQHSERKDALPKPQLAAALLTGGQDRHYTFGLATALISENVALDIIGGRAEDGPEMHAMAALRFLDLYRSQQDGRLTSRIKGVLLSYVRLIQYARTAKPKLFHILWNYKLRFFDRILLMLYYKILGKKVVLTAHNVDADRRDAKESLTNRLTLQLQYKLSDHIFVHTQKMKDELIDGFHVSRGAVTIIPYGINNAVPSSNLTAAEARRRLRLRDGEKTILFFGAIKPYKGLEYLVTAFQRLGEERKSFRLIIAGERKKGSEDYLSAIERMIDADPLREQVIRKIEFIPDDEIEVYFKAADVAVLPYTEIFQSGILFLAYAFGLPVIATDVGSFREDIVEGRTGLVCRPRDSSDLARAIVEYFDSDLFGDLDRRRQEIYQYVRSMHSWDVVANITREVYATLLMA
jgi:glycosyltransferase involved in cell wall biosynthesis